MVPIAVTSHILPWFFIFYSYGLSLSFKKYKSKIEINIINNRPVLRVICVLIIGENNLHLIIYKSSKLLILVCFNL